MKNANWLKIVSRTLKDNSPAILSGISVAGVIGTAVLAARCHVNARIELADATINSDDENRDLTLKETVQATWKCYIPAAISGAATIACIVGANQIGARRNAALLGAYTIVDSAFREYKDKVIETIGEAKEKKVVEEIHQDRIDRNPTANTQVIITGGGDSLCYDTLTGRYFKSDIEAIRKAANDINAMVIHDMYASQNEFYRLLGLGDVVVGDELGWNLDVLMELEFTSHLSDCGQPCIAIGYAHLPIKDYGKF